MMRPRMYEITFVGQAGPVLGAAFNDCQVTVGPGTTTLRARLPDSEALNRLMGRITAFGLTVIRIRLLAPSLPLRS